MPRVTSSLPWMVVLLAQVWACGPERPPQAEAERSKPTAAAAEAEPATLDADNDQFVLSYAGDKGVFADATSIAEVPEAARNRVGVNVFGRKPPPGKVWIANLDAPLPDGRYALELIDRDEFEEAVLGSGRASVFELPTDLDALDQLGAREAPVIVYKTSWCGVCKQLESYLKRKGVEYVAKDIEQDREAAAELAAKAKQAGVPTGSVPMIDIDGKLLRGFDRNALDKLL